MSPSNRKLRSIAAVASVVPLAAAAASGPCDIYAAGNTPCIAAHSTTRALFAAYSGPLYSVLRNSDGTTINISPLAAGGVANAAAQDKFCANTTCLIDVIYDQSGHGNGLSQAPPGGNGYGPDPGGYDILASAIGAPVTLKGQKAYGVFMSPTSGYRNNSAVGTAENDDPEGMYAVMDGTHFNDGCCFDYGNAERSSDDTGSGHMETIYFGTNSFWGRGAGNGPWIMADQENGLFPGQSFAVNPNNPTQTSRFISAFVKGEPNNWAIRGGSALNAKLATYYSGVRPTGYNPMHKEGAIVLGDGGDNSIGAQGTFYEGVMTTGYPSDATEGQVQANIASAGYAITSLVSGPAVTVGSTVTMRVTTPNYTNRYIAHNGSAVNTEVITNSSPSTLQATGQWKVVTGLGNSGCVSFESVDTAGSYIRHFNYQLMLNANDGTPTFADDSTFCPMAALNGQGNSIRSWSYPTRFFRNYASVMYIASEGGPDVFDNTAYYNDDVSYVVASDFSG